MTQPFPLLPPLSFLAVLSLSFLTGVGVSPPENFWNYRCLYRWVLEKFRHKHHFIFTWNGKVNFPPNFLIFVTPLDFVMRFALSLWTPVSPGIFVHEWHCILCHWWDLCGRSREYATISLYVKNNLLHLLTVFFEWLVGWLVRCNCSNLWLFSIYLYFVYLFVNLFNIDVMQIL